MMGLYIISDLHIVDEHDPYYLVLIDLIQKLKSGDTLILAGDIFDLLIGKKLVFMNRYHDFLELLKTQVLSGVEVHYIEGNHDFDLQDVFASIPRLKVYPQEMIWENANKRFLILHGDTVDREDYAYQFLRFFLRTFFMRWFIKVLPGHWLDGIGRWSSRQSKQHRSKSYQRSLSQMRNLYRNAAVERMKEGFDFIVMGHCHDMDEIVFQWSGYRTQYINVGYPRVHHSYLFWSEGQSSIQRIPFEAR